LGIYVTCVRDQGLEVVQIVIHCPASLVIGGAFQSIDCVHFHINWEEVNPELLLKVSPGLDGENASVYFLTKHVFDHLVAQPLLKNVRAQRILSSSLWNCSGARQMYREQEFRNAWLL